MTDEGSPDNSPKDLRGRTEMKVRKLAASLPENLTALSPEHAARLLHELRVHQIELEMQNEELIRAQAELDASRAQYFNLYDLAPVGYFTLSKEGVIMAANLTASTLLDVPRSSLVGQPLTRLVLTQDQDIYHLHRKGAVETGLQRSSELRLRRQDGSVFWALLDITMAQDSGGAPLCRVVISDITERKQAEEKQQAAAARILLQREIISRIAISRWVNEGHVVKAAAHTTEAVAIAFNIERVSVWLFNENEMELVCADLYEATPGKHTVGAVLFGHEFKNWFQGLKNARYLAAENPLTDPWTAGCVEIYLKPLGITSMLGGVIVSGDRNLGVLCFEHVDRPHHWEQDEISFNCQLADQIGMAVLNRERRKAEEALLESENKFRSIFERSPVGILLISGQGTVLDCNQHCADIFEAQRKDYLGLNLLETLRAGPVRQALVDTIADGALRYYEGPYVSVLSGKSTHISVTCEWVAPDLLIAVIMDITERTKAEEQIVRSLKEKEVLLKEIHHRVKNNMQVISSLLNLQTRAVTDPTTRTVFEDARNRVNSMALIHQKLYQSENLAHINFNEYLRSLVDGIADTYKRSDVVVSVDREPIALDVNTGIPCGLIVNELVSNCFKYAFPKGRKGTITVGVRRTSDGNNVLTVADSGIGFPEAVDFHNTSSLGLQLVNVLTGQIHGTIELLKTEGTTFRITFPG